jgi:hypothetical protein
MIRQELRQVKIFYLFIVILLALAVSGCSIKLVADYDASTFEEILKVSKKVDRFYGGLLEAQESDRQYSKYTDQWVDIETDIRSLITRNQARPLNEESTKISENILGLWVKYKDNHHGINGYSSGMSKLDRKRFTRLFNAASAAELAKKMDPDDSDVSKASK